MLYGSMKSSEFGVEGFGLWVQGLGSRVSVLGV